MTEKVHRTRLTLPFSSRAELEFWSGRAAVTLLPLRSDEEATVEVAGLYADHPEVHIERVGNVVRVEVERDDRSPHASDRNNTQIALTVPRSVRARIHSDAGSIEARDLGPCALRAETGAGRIALFDVYGQLQLSTGAGQIAGRGIGGRIAAETNAGAILLGISALDPGDHFIHANAGAIRLELARNLNARVEINSRRGSVHTDYPVRDHAAAVLRVSTDVGSVRVHGIHASGVPSFLSDDLPPRSARHFSDTWKPEPGPNESPDLASEERPSSEAVAREAEMERILRMVETGEYSIQDAKANIEALVRELAEGYRKSTS